MICIMKPSHRSTDMPPQTVAIVTGAADEIGWATARRLAQEFNHIVIVDLNVGAAGRGVVGLGEKT